MTSLYREQLKANLNDPEFKREYGAGLAQNEIALLINNARSTARLTQAELAEIMGVSQAYIAKLESGNANPSVSKVGEILALLNKQIKAHYVAIVPTESRGSREAGIDLPVELTRISR